MWRAKISVPALPVVLLLALLMSGDSRRIAPPAPATDAEIIEFLESLIGGLRLHRQLWYDYSGATRRQMTGPADSRLQKHFDHVVAVAKERSFTFRVPAVRRTTVPTDFQFRNVPGRVMGRYFGDAGYILVDGDIIDRMDDPTLDCLLAHELGHGIDHQSERLGHPLLEKAGEMPSEEMADTIAISICGASEWVDFHETWLK